MADHPSPATRGPLFADARDLLGWRLLLPRVVMLGTLMTGAALTESLGLIMLVPLLGALVGKTPAIGFPGLADWAQTAGLDGILALFVVLVTLRTILQYARSVEQARFRQVVVGNLRGRVWDALLHAEWRTLAGMQRADLINLLITSVERVGTAAGETASVASLTVTLAGIGLAACAISPLLALLALACGVLGFVALFAPRARARRYGAQLSHAYARMYHVVGEGLAGLRTIKSLGAEDRAASAAQDAFAALRQVEINFVRSSQSAAVWMQTFAAAGVAAIVWLAVSRLAAPVAALLPILAILIRAVPLLTALNSSLQLVMHSIPAFGEIAAVLQKCEAQREPADSPVEIPLLAREISLSGVTVRFAGRGRPALDKFDLTLPARVSLHVTGSSGAGKSTLADVLGGLCIPDCGTMAVDGVVLDRAALRAWRRRVAYVHQSPFMPDGTIREALAMAAPDADDAAMQAALRRASAGFVLELPGGLETPLGEGGSRFSGGERQRLALARALLRSPDLLILDEATSALDPVSEEAVVQAIALLSGQLTIVIIDHRGALASLATQTVALGGNSAAN